jgi:hypothetical protein
MKRFVILAVMLAGIAGVDTSVANFREDYLAPLIIFIGSTLGLMLIKNFIDSLGNNTISYPGSYRGLQEPTLPQVELNGYNSTHESISSIYPLRNQKQKAKRTVSGK